MLPVGMPLQEMAEDVPVQASWVIKHRCYVGVFASDKVIKQPSLPVSYAVKAKS